MSNLMDVTIVCTLKQNRFSSSQNLTCWQLNLGVVSGTPLWVWTTPVCPSILCFQLCDCYREGAGRNIFSQSKPPLTCHVCAFLASFSLTEELPVIPVVRWVRTHHCYCLSHDAALFGWPHTAPLCETHRGSRPHCSLSRLTLQMDVHDSHSEWTHDEIIHICYDKSYMA